MAKGCKCDPHEICEECPEWIFTLADLIMCMMGLFVILWVLKPGLTAKSESASNKETEQTKVIAAIREAFGHEPDPGSRDPIDMYMIMQQMSRRSDGPREKGMLKTPLESAAGTDPEVTTVRAGKQSLVGVRVLFARDEAKLDENSGSALNDIATQVRGHRNIIMVKGHASLDDLSDDATPQKKMDLSIRRAQAIADYLIEHGVSPEILRVQGCSTFEPVLQRAYTPEALAQNRRTEVEVTATLVEEFQDRQKAGAASRVN